MQDAHRIDPNDLRCLPAGVAWIVHGGHAGKVAVSRSEAFGTATTSIGPMSAVVAAAPSAAPFAVEAAGAQPPPAPAAPTAFAEDDI